MGPVTQESARPLRAVIFVFSVILVVGVAAWFLRPQDDVREQGGVAALNEPFPGLQGESLIGPPIDTDHIDWSVLVINVWASWCTPCRREQPALLRVQDATRDRGVTFLGVDYQDDRAAATRWVEEQYEVDYPSLWDPSGRTAATLDFPFIPVTYLVDSAGITRYAIYGETSAKELTGLIDGLLRV